MNTTSSHFSYYFSISGGHLLEVVYFLCEQSDGQTRGKKRSKSKKKQSNSASDDKPEVNIHVKSYQKYTQTQQAF